jgi:transmembrane sensor
MSRTERETAVSPRDCEDQAAEFFARRHLGNWTADDQAALDARVARDGAFADALRRIEQSWHAVGVHAASPELMALREQAVSRARRAGARRWGGWSQARRGWRIASVITGLGVALGAGWQLSPLGYRPGLYETGIGEQQTLELADHSRVTLDARTRLRVRFSPSARVVQLMEGQAQFSVARDPSRSFKVEAGEHTVVAVGTMFTVEYVDREVHIVMLEGKVAVIPTAGPSEKFSERPHLRRARVDTSDASGADIIELTAGEEMRVSRDDHATVVPKADLEAATAWRLGRVIFRNEALGDAIRRVNRYSRLQLELQDSSLAQLKVSGVFEAGDTQAFAEALRSYLPLSANYVDSKTIRLTAKENKSGSAALAPDAAVSADEDSTNHR